MDDPSFALMFLLAEFDLIFKGSDALERKGAYYTVSDKDHPITKLMQSPYKVPRRTNVLVSLTTREVRRVSLEQGCQIWSV